VQLAPDASGVLHVPVPELHVPGTWHGSAAEQVTGLAPMHTPFWQVSVCVHAFPSLHVVPVLGTQVPVDDEHA
jgi:hypothetical protein